MNPEDSRSSGYVPYEGPVSVAITTNQQSDGTSRDGSAAFMCMSSGDETIDGLISERISLHGTYKLFCSQMPNDEMYPLYPGSALQAHSYLTGVPENNLFQHVSSAHALISLPRHINARSGD